MASRGSRGDPQAIGDAAGQLGNHARKDLGSSSRAARLTDASTPDGGEILPGGICRFPLATEIRGPAPCRANPVPREAIVSRMFAPLPLASRIWSRTDFPCPAMPPADLLKDFFNALPESAQGGAESAEHRRPSNLIRLAPA